MAALFADTSAYPDPERYGNWTMNQADKPVVSVIVPVYNAADCLQTCLQSLADQTLQDIEILCVDDASLDGSREVVQEFARQDPRFHLLCQEHLGVSAARNLGIDTARGKYLAFLDADDWAEPHMLERMVQAAERENCDVAICSAQVHFADSAQQGTRSGQALCRNLTAREETLPLNGTDGAWDAFKRPGCWPFIWNKLIRRDLIVNNRIRFPVGLPLGEDGVFLQVLFQYVRRVAFLEEAFYHYRYLRKDSVTVRLSSDRTLRFDRHIQVVQTLCTELADRALLEPSAVHAEKWILWFLYSDFVSLPVCGRRTAAEKLDALFTRFSLAGTGPELTKLEKKRWKYMRDPSAACSESRRKWDILRTKIENRLSKIIK